MMPDFPQEYEAAGIRQLTGEYNAKVKRDIEEKHGMTLKEIYNDNYICRELVGIFQCPGCGNFIQLSALKFFNFDTEKARCLKCQNLHF